MPGFSSVIHQTNIMCPYGRVIDVLETDIILKVLRRSLPLVQLRERVSESKAGSEESCKGIVYRRIS